ncbi:hypothetical protein G7068_13685 [Leucobacter viscericola]|uniref:Uncharacterized protein n=1 Tax=Leucobacter viscericola TaxID=2714935 RepID=A0A6G7XHQ0_9MICO|nr:hypothetical protein [Leucobacter viscericola]QIK64130.1 hypothetical protein G7068_13685 [Leucobacter viscericola]
MTKTAEQVFKAAWHEADAEGKEGERVAAGLDALRLAGLLVGEPSEEQRERAKKVASGVFIDGNPFSNVEDAWIDGFTEGSALPAAGVTPPAPTCQTCNGIGLVGSNHMNSGECPDCVTAIRLEREKQALERVWKAMGCAGNPDAYKPSVRDIMWKQVVEYCERQNAGNNRLHRENEELRAALASPVEPVTVNEAKLAEIVCELLPLAWVDSSEISGASVGRNIARKMTEGKDLWLRGGGR